MTTTRFSMRVLATLTLWAGFGLPAFAQLPALTLDNAFATKPRQPSVTIATPASESTPAASRIPGRPMPEV